MSRSKGNVILVSTLKEQGIDPMAFRYLLLTAHYRSKLNFTDESIDGSAERPEQPARRYRRIACASSC